MRDLDLPPPEPDGVPTAPPGGGVPGYELIRELGRGGTAVVYLARQITLDRSVALKMVLAGEFASPEDRLRFVGEAEAVAAIQHPGIVQVYEVGASDDRPYFALEYCPGGSLAQRLADSPLPPREAAALIRQVAGALHAAHTAGVVHRDVKPGNILFAADGSPKVTDFGLAKQLDSTPGLTRTGAVLGTPGYMAPEQARGTKGIGPATDVYALGAVLYECLTGRPPFLAATALDTVLQALHDEPVPPSRLTPKVPRDLETICLKCLQKDPARRYPSAGELADDLQRFLEGRPIAARPVPAWERVWKAARRRPAPAAAVLVTVLAAAVVLGVVLDTNARLQRERDEADAARQAAIIARASETRQRQLAHMRLQKAVEAVERMMTRVASERWATRPDLQEERRQVLEDAVAFFNSFVAEDSRDPVVRREAATAHMQVAGAYMALGKYDRCRASAQAAYDLRKSLATESPTDPGPIRGMAEAVGLLGRVSAITGEHEEAYRRYETAVGLAQLALKLDPDSPDSKLVLAESYTALGQFLDSEDSRTATDYYWRANRLAAELVERPGAGFRDRLARALPIVCLGVRGIADGSPEGVRLLEEARPLIDRLDQESPPTARAQEQYGLARAALHLYLGVHLTRSGRRDEGMKAAVVGMEGLDALLVVHPRSFPLRAQKLRFLIMYGDLLDMAGRHEAARTAFAQFTELRAQLLLEFPHLLWLKRIGLVQQSHNLAMRARQGDGQGLDEAARELLREADPKIAFLVRYNWACAHAQLAKTGRPADRDRHSARAVELLDELRQGGYFQGRAELAHLEVDADFDPIRDRPEFRQFLTRLRTRPASTLGQTPTGVE